MKRLTIVEGIILINKINITLSSAGVFTDRGRIQTLNKVCNELIIKVNELTDELNKLNEKLNEKELLI